MVDFAVLPKHTALVNVDLQNCFVAGAPDGLATLDQVSRLAEACREAGILVIHTSHPLRADGSNMAVLGEDHALLAVAAPFGPRMAYVLMDQLPESLFHLRH